MFVFRDRSFVKKFNKFVCTSRYGMILFFQFMKNGRTKKRCIYIYSICMNCTMVSILNFFQVV
jgi:hypothetical protein